MGNSTRERENKVFASGNALEAYFLAASDPKANKSILQDIIIKAADKFLKEHGSYDKITDKDMQFEASDIAEAAYGFAKYVKFEGLDLDALHNVVVSLNVPQYINLFKINVKHYVQPETLEHN